MASILLLEGDPDVRRLLLIVLTDLGHAATTLEEIPRDADLVIVDPISPSHRELARCAREQEPRLPVICTSFVKEPRFPGTGPLVHLQKPFAADELAAAIDGALA